MNARMGKASQRVVNLGDVVPHLPPEYLGFSHTGKRVLFHTNGRRSRSSADWVESKVENSSWLVRKAKQVVKKLDVKNHQILDGKGGYIYWLQRDL